MKKPIQIGQWAAFILLFAATALPCSAADAAVLRNGFSIRHERRQVIGTITRLYIDGDDSSFVDVPTAEIDHFEALPAEPSPRGAANKFRTFAISFRKLPAFDGSERGSKNSEWSVPSGSGSGQQRDSRRERLQCAGSLAEGRAGINAVNAPDRLGAGRAKCF